MLRQLLAHRSEKGAQRRLGLGAGTLHPLLCGAALAEMQGGDLLVDDLGEVDDRLALVALFARHQGIDSTPESGTRRPPSRDSTRSARPANERLWVTTTRAVSNSRDRCANSWWSRSLLALSRLPE